MPEFLTGGRIFTGERILEGQALLLQGGRIEALLPESAVPASASVVSLRGQLLVPGFIDTQVNGGGGVLFNDHPGPDTLRTIGAVHRRHGTTGFLPTLISDRRDTMEAALAAVRQALKDGVPGVLGIHLEGPYLNPERCGVHPRAVLRAPEADALALLSSLGRAGVTLVTLAPERVPPGFIRELVSAGVIVSAGHSAASYAEIAGALGEGLSGFTHLFNAMSPLTSREPGVVGAALEDPASWCSLIVDNHHVHPATLKVALQAKPRGKMLLVTDAIHSVGAAGERFQLLGQTIERRAGRVTTLDGTLAGSDLTMAGALRNCVNLLGVALEEALRMASLYPAQFLGLAGAYGRIAPGYRASLALLDDQLEVTETWIEGRASGR